MVGQTVDATTVIYAMSDKLIVKADVDETDIGRSARACPRPSRWIPIPTNLLTERCFKSCMKGVNVSNVITYGVKIEPKNVPPFFRSQMTANISLISKKKDNVVLLAGSRPPAPPPGERQVMVPGPDGKPVARVVQVGLETGDQAEITDGITDGDPFWSSANATHRSRPPPRARCDGRARNKGNRDRVAEASPQWT